MTTTKAQYPLKTYPAREEKLNILSHALGVIFGIIAIYMMLIKVIPFNNTIYIFAFLIYGISIITLFGASTLFHSAKTPKIRYKLNILDHCAIFFLIAGTYTPYTLIVLSGKTGWILFSAIWCIALIGILLKLFFTGKYRILSTVIYVLMGWAAVFAFKPLYQNMHSNGFAWLIFGGIAYTLGAVLYAIKKIPYNHAIFHIFVLIITDCP